MNRNTSDEAKQQTTFAAGIVGILFENLSVIDDRRLNLSEVEVFL